MKVSIYSRSLLTILIVIILAGFDSYAANAGDKPLSHILSADGAILPNTAGSFDPSGYRLSYGPNGEPRFLPKNSDDGTCSDNWDTSFSLTGADNYVYDVAADGNGNFYIGGWFRSINNVMASGIAKWDGTNWTNLGSGVNGMVRDIAISGTDVYIAGAFTNAGGIAANNVAKWDGSSWSALGAGMGSSQLFQDVQTIAVSGNDVYVGGSFDFQAGFPNKIARWNGTSWSGLGNGVDSHTVYEIEVINGIVYAGGNFNSVSGTPITGLAKWDGNAWSQVGSGINGRVHAMAVSGTDLYVGGAMGVSSVGASNIAKWDGTNWSALGSGIGGGISTPVMAITVSGNNVYAGGTFLSAGGSAIPRLAHWNGTQWNAVGGTVGTGGQDVMGLAFSGGKLMAGGSFNIVGTAPASYVAAFSSGSWNTFAGSGLSSAVNAIAVSGEDVYIGGGFTTAGSTVVNKIVKWNGSTWSALGTGFTGANSNVNAIAVAGNKVYVGGTFTNAGGTSANNVAVWNGTAWSALGTGTDATVFTMMAEGNDLYVGGSFQNAGGVSAHRIAKWNGTSWSGLNSAIIPSSVTAIVRSGNDLYVGATSTAVENPNYFLKYDGSIWTGLGAGMGGHGITSIAVIGNDVYISGGFQAVGGISAARVAKWNGTTWTALSSGLPGNSNQVRLAVSGNDLIAVGDFLTANGGPADRIARWNGTTWQGLGSGLNANVRAVTVSGGSVYVGGEFSTAGCRLSPHFARWRETVWSGSAGSDWHNVANWSGGSIPSANAGVTISTNNASIISSDVTLSSLIVSNGRTMTIGSGRTLTINGNANINGAAITGAGNLIVNGDLTVNNSTISTLASIQVTGTVYLMSGSIASTGNISLTSCRPDALIGGDATSYFGSKLSRCVSPNGVYRFPVGSGSKYAPVELSNITGSSMFSVDPVSGAYAGAASGLPADRLLRWWQLTSEGVSKADLSFGYNDDEVVGWELPYRTYHINGGVATRLNTDLNMSSNRAVTTNVTSFGSFTLAAAPSTLTDVTGRITTAGGRGAVGIFVSMTDPNGNVRYATTNPLGYYRFKDVSTFVSHTVRVYGKRYTFSSTERTVVIDEHSSNLNFTSLDH